MQLLSSPIYFFGKQYGHSQSNRNLVSMWPFISEPNISSQKIISSLLCSSQYYSKQPKPGTAQMSKDRWLDKETMAYILNRTLLDCKKN